MEEVIFTHLNLDTDLTPTQEHVVKLLAQGFTYQEVADYRMISRRALDYQTAIIRKKINGFDRADIVVFAIKTKLVKI